MVHLKYPI